MTSEQKEKTIDLLYKVIKQVSIKALVEGALTQFERDLIVQEFLEGIDKLFPTGDQHG